jgi:hypothetical protein
VRPSWGIISRVVVVAAVVGALWGPSWRDRAPRADWVVVVDQSASVDPTASQALVEESLALNPTDVDVHVIAFDSAPVLVTEATTALGGEGSDGKQALELALGLVPDAGRIVLASDGHFTSSLTEPLAEAAERGIVVDRLALPSKTGDFVQDLQLPVTLAPQATLQGLLVGEGEVRVDDAVAELTDATFTADPEGDRVEVTATLGEHVRTELVLRSGPPTVLVLAAHDKSVAPLVGAYREEGFTVDVFTPSKLVEELPDPSLYDLVVIGDLPAYAEEGLPVLPPSLIHDVRRAVSSGTGLIALGSENSYELGGWDVSELGPVLPVTSSPQDGRGTARLAMGIMLDKSGSMGARVGGQTKMQLANEGTVAAMQLLRPDDMLTVASVDSGSHFSFPLMQVAPGSMEKKIRKISHGGGGIYTYTALEDVQRALRQADAPLKHVILFTDAADSEEHYKGTIFGWGPGRAATSLAREMWTQGISLTVIAIGSPHDQDTPFLRQLAEAGGGRFYLTSDARQLKGLFVKETRRLVGSAVRERAYKPKAKLDHPATRDVDFRKNPWLEGYVKVKPRPTSEVVLEGALGDPLLVTWRYGLGNVAALATDAGPRWGGDFTGSPAYVQFHSQLARWAQRSETTRDVDALLEGESLTLTVLRRDQDGFARDETLVAFDGDNQVALTLVEPGLWQAVLPVVPGQELHVRFLANGEEVLTHDQVIEPYREYRGPAGTAWLADAAISSLDTPPLPAPRERGQPLGRGFALLALVLLPIDALLRRPLRA